MSSIMELLIAGVSGGGITALFTYLVSRQKENRGDFDAIIQTWAEDNRRLRDQELENRARIIALEEENRDVRSKVALLESATQDLPLPMWLKDNDGRMLAINRPYEEEFLLPMNLAASDYIGKTDFDIWPEDVAKKFRAHDSMVRRTKKTFKGYEMMPDENGEPQRYQIIKYIRYAGRVAIGIGGIAIHAPLEH